MSQPWMRLSATVLGTPDPPVLAGFYRQLLGWNLVAESPVWCVVRPASGGTGLSFQHEPDFVPPVWPPEPGAQMMTSHLDIGVEDVDAAVDRAIKLGARLADHQPQDHVRVMRDPAGHVFCLFPEDPV